MPNSKYIRKALQQQTRAPAPLGGLNFINGTLDMPATDAYLLDNMLPRPYGAEIRKGWRYWLPTGSELAGEVRTIMVYNAFKPAYSKIFASADTADGAIYDVTSINVAPAVAITPSTVSDVPGEWYWANYITPGGNFLCCVSAGAGYFTYTSDSAGVGTWTERVEGTTPGEIEFPAGDSTTLADLAFCWTWKNRLWFIKKDSSVAYYLPTSQVAGKLTAFDFGTQLTHGSTLLFGAAWTYDSGSGIDDGLVLASKEGDILVYEGSDPDTAAEFRLKGVWYAGRFPYGRRCFCQHGGNLLFLNEYGVISVADLVAGRIHSSTLTGDIGHKVNPRMARLVSSTIEEKYWFLLPYPTEELLLVGSPYVNESVGVRQSFAVNSLTEAWCSISEMDILCAEMFQGNMIIGTRSGAIIWGFTGWQDGVSSDGLTLGTEVTGRMQGPFYDFGNNNANKRLLRVKLYGLADSAPSFFVAFRSEYELNNLISTPAPVAATLPVWDTAIWDQDIWNASSGSFHKWFGVCGWGKKLSMQMAIRGSSRVLFTDYEVLFETGIGL